MQAVEGIYQNGHIKLLETPKEIRRARVVVTFLDDELTTATDNQESLVGSIEILDDDLETASLEIHEEFLAAIEKSCAEFDK
ncbi:MAG: hypothetical protein ACR2J3_02935 [Aridibacter sp.]